MSADHHELLEIARHFDLDVPVMRGATDLRLRRRVIAWQERPVRQPHRPAAADQRADPDQQDHRAAQPGRSRRTRRHRPCHVA